MLHAAAEGAALNVQINISSITDQEFVGWRTDEVVSLQRTCRMMAEEIMQIVRTKINPS